MQSSSRVMAFKSRWTALGAVLAGIWLAAAFGAQRVAPRARPAPGAAEAQAEGRPRAPAAKGARAPSAAPRAARAWEDPPDPYGDRISGEEQLAHERLEARFQTQRAALEARFRHEPVDREWAEQYSRHIQSVLDERGIAKQAVLGVECKATLCRLEIDDADAQLPALSAVAGQLATQYWLLRGEGTSIDVLIERPAPAGLKPTPRAPQGI